MNSFVYKLNLLYGLNASPSNKVFSKSWFNFFFIKEECLFKQVCAEVMCIAALWEFPCSSTWRLFSPLNFLLQKNPVPRVLGRSIKYARAAAGSVTTTLEHCSLTLLHCDLKGQGEKTSARTLLNYTSDCALELLTLHSYLKI